MFYDQGCFGRIEVGPISDEVAARLLAIPGEWLEFDPPSGAIVVRHVEPSSTRHLPAIAFELVRIFSEIPSEFHGEIPGGDLFVHTEEEHGQFVRMRVEPGGTIHIQWAHPDFKRSLRRPYAGGTELTIDPEVQRLDGAVTFNAGNPEDAARAVQDFADTYEGLYPEGDCLAQASGGLSVELTMAAVNLDAARLVDLLQTLALPRSLSGGFEVSSFGTILPERQLRFLFEKGKTWFNTPFSGRKPTTER